GRVQGRCDPRRGKGSRGLSNRRHRKISVRRSRRMSQSAREEALLMTPIPANRAVLEAAMIEGRFVRATGRKAIGISTDRRAIVPGNAFVAIKGGHTHQKEAVDAGAVLLVAE